MCLALPQMATLQSKLGDAHAQLQSLAELYAITKRLQVQNAELQQQLKLSGDQVRSLVQAASQRQQQLVELQRLYNGTAHDHGDFAKREARLKAQLREKTATLERYGLVLRVVMGSFAQLQSAPPGSLTPDAISSVLAGVVEKVAAASAAAVPPTPARDKGSTRRRHHSHSRSPSAADRHRRAQQDKRPADGGGRTARRRSPPQRRVPTQRGLDVSHGSRGKRAAPLPDAPRVGADVGQGSRQGNGNSASASNSNGTGDANSNAPLPSLSSLLPPRRGKTKARRGRHVRTVPVPQAPAPATQNENQAPPGVDSGGDPTLKPSAAPAVAPATAPHASPQTTGPSGKPAKLPPRVRELTSQPAVPMNAPKYPSRLRISISSEDLASMGAAESGDDIHGGQSAGDGDGDEIRGGQSAGDGDDFVDPRVRTREQASVDDAGATRARRKLMRGLLGPDSDDDARRSSVGSVAREVPAVVGGVATDGGGGTSDADSDDGDGSDVDGLEHVQPMLRPSLPWMRSGNGSPAAPSPPLRSMSPMTPPPSGTRVGTRLGFEDGAPRFRTSLFSSGASTSSLDSGFSADEDVKLAGAGGADEAGASAGAGAVASDAMPSPRNRHMFTMPDDTDSSGE